MPEAKDPRLDELQARREFNEGKQVDNSTLEAGSPMYYYCKTCGAHVATKPEGWWQNAPPSHCAPCKDLLADGVLGYTDLFDDWERKRKQEGAST